MITVGCSELSHIMRDRSEHPLENIASCSRSVDIPASFFAKAKLSPTALLAPPGRIQEEKEELSLDAPESTDGDPDRRLQDPDPSKPQKLQDRSARKLPADQVRLLDPKEQPSDSSKPKLDMHRRRLLATRRAATTTP